MQIAGAVEILAPLPGAELAALAQYQAESSLFALWGLAKLSEHQEAESLEERGHLRVLLDRILFLEGTPDYSRYSPPVLSEDVEAILRHDLATELSAVATYTQAMTALCEANDHESYRLLGKILRDEQGHANWLETQLSLLGKLGLPNWLQMWA